MAHLMTSVNFKYIGGCWQVLGSLDVNATLYSQVIQVQPPTTETIDNFKEIVKKLLLSFYHFNRKQKPRKIIYFRDGVSEGQFEMVMMIEMYRIQQACRELEPGYEPKMTMVVVQKRHHTRFFPENPQDGTGRMRNVPPGTVVDDIITHPTEFDYYLCSHEGIQVSKGFILSVMVLIEDLKVEVDVRADFLPRERVNRPTIMCFMMIMASLPMKFRS